MKLKYQLSIVAFATLCAVAAHATSLSLITDAGNPSLSGSVTETFSNVPTGLYQTLTATDDLNQSIMTLVGQLPKTMSVNALPNPTVHLAYNVGNTDTLGIIFNFSTAISAFGFQFEGLTGTPATTLTAYSDTAETMQIGTTQTFPCCDLSGFFGLADNVAEIRSIALQTNQAFYFGNVQFVAPTSPITDGPVPTGPAGVPEPNSLALAGLAMAGLAAMLRRRPAVIA